MNKRFVFIVLVLIKSSVLVGMQQESISPADLDLSCLSFNPLQVQTAYDLANQSCPETEEEIALLNSELDKIYDQDGSFNQFLKADSTFNYTPLHIAVDNLNFVLLKRIFTSLKRKEIVTVLSVKSTLSAPLGECHLDGDTITFIALRRLAVLYKQPLANAEQMDQLIWLLNFYLLPYGLIDQAMRQFYSKHLVLSITCSQLSYWFYNYNGCRKNSPREDETSQEAAIEFITVSELQEKFPQMSFLSGVAPKALPAPKLWQPGFESPLTPQQLDLVAAIRDFDEPVLIEHAKALEVLPSQLNKKMTNETGEAVQPLIVEVKFGYYGALLHAVTSKNINSLRYILAKISDLNVILEPIAGLTALHLAIVMLRSNGTIDPFVLDVVREFSSHSAFEIDKKNKEGSTALHIAARSHLSFELLKALVEHGADREAVDLDGYTPLDCLIECLYEFPDVCGGESYDCINVFIKPSDDTQSLSKISPNLMLITMLNLANRRYASSQCVSSVFRIIYQKYVFLVKACLLQPIQTASLKDPLFDFLRATPVESNALLCSLEVLRFAQDNKKIFTWKSEREELRGVHQRFTDFVCKLLMMASRDSWFDCLAVSEREQLTNLLYNFNETTGSWNRSRLPCIIL